MSPTLTIDDGAGGEYEGGLGENLYIVGSKDHLWRRSPHERLAFRLKGPLPSNTS